MAAVESATPAVPEQDLVPITANQRIEALDVVRGFALLGIFLMNIEYFNRTLSSLNQGMPRGLTGIDWFASWFIPIAPASDNTLHIDWNIARQTYHILRYAISDRNVFIAIIIEVSKRDPVPLLEMPGS